MLRCIGGGGELLAVLVSRCRSSERNLGTLRVPLCSCWTSHCESCRCVRYVMKVFYILILMCIHDWLNQWGVNDT